jgi:hypothetical protein
LPEVLWLSLTVSSQLLDDARRDAVSDESFVQCVQTSLPYAYDLIARLTTELQAGERPFTDNQVPPPDEAARGQLLRALSSDAIRGALERHFDVTLAFQNCHRVAVFPPHAEASAEYAEFTSVRNQVLNQRPEFVNC